MLVITSKEFKEKPINYLNQVDKGIEILIKRGKKKSYKLISVEDDTLMSKEEFFAKIDRSYQQIEEGKCATVSSKEELIQYLNSL